MQKPNPELIDDENPEWTEETFANAVPFSALPMKMQELLQSPKKVVLKGETGRSKKLEVSARAETDDGRYNQVPDSSIPLSPIVRAAYEDLYNKIQAEIDNTMDAVALEALNPQLKEVDQVLTKDDEYKLSKDTAVFAALKTQINCVNQGLKTLRAEIASTVSHFATAGVIIGAIDKVLTLVAAVPSR